MKTVRITDNLSATDAPVVKLTCDCGWTEKAFANRDAPARGEVHLRTKHTKGLITYQGHSYTVETP